MAGIRTMDDANRFLDAFIIKHNEKFSVAAAEQGTAFVPYRGNDLDLIFSKHHERVVGNDNTITFGKLGLQIEPQTFRFSMARCRVMVCEHLDETISVHYGPHVLGTYSREGQLLTPSRRKEHAA